MAIFRINEVGTCSMKELYNISVFNTPVEVVKATAQHMLAFNDGYIRNPAFLLFSGVVGEVKRVYDERFHLARSDDYAQNLADYILANGLGVVTATPPALNHSGNMVRGYLWAPEWKALEAIYIAERERVRAEAVA